MLCSVRRNSADGSLSLPSSPWPAISPDIRTALCGGTNRFRDTYDTLHVYERADWPAQPPPPPSWASRIPDSRLLCSRHSPHHRSRHLSPPPIRRPTNCSARRSVRSRAAVSHPALSCLKWHRLQSVSVAILSTSISPHPTSPNRHRGTVHARRTEKRRSEFLRRAGQLPLF